MDQGCGDCNREGTSDLGGGGGVEGTIWPKGPSGPIMPSRSKIKSQLRQPAKSSTVVAAPINKTTSAAAALNETRTVAVEWTSLLGHRVKVCGKKTGTLRYYGRTLFAEGDWCGVVLDDADGMNDGSVKGVRYFECPPGHGLFAPEAKVELMVQDSGDSNAQSSRSRGDDPEETFAVKRLSGVSSVEELVFGGAVGPGTSTPVLGVPKAFGDELNGTFSVRRLDETFQKEAANQTFVTTEKSSRNNETFVAAGNGEDVKGLEELGEFGEDMEEDDDVEDLEVVPTAKGRQGSLEMDDSLGILTPDQMRDFTLAMVGAARTPSDEGIQELGYDLEEDLADASASEGVPSTSAKAFGDMTPRTCDLLAEGARELLMTTPFTKRQRLSTATPNKVGISDMTFPNMPEIDNTFDVSEVFATESKQNVTVVLREADVQHLADKGSEDGERVEKQSTTIEEFNRIDIEMTREKDAINAEVTVDTVDPKPLEEVVPEAVSIKRVVMIATDIPKLKEKNVTAPVAVEKDKDRERPQSSLTVSATSIDTGYQGDAECDPQSEANSPVDTEAKSFAPSVATATKPKVSGDPSCGGSDSDFCSDMGASWTESEEDANNQNQAKLKSSNARDVRIIDGHVYYVVGLHHRVSTSPVAPGVVPKNGPGTVLPPIPPQLANSTLPNADLDASSVNITDLADLTVVIPPEDAMVPIEEPEQSSPDNVEEVHQAVVASPTAEDDVPQLQTDPQVQSPVTPPKVLQEIAVTPPKSSESTSPKGKGSSLKKGTSVMSKIKAMVMGSGGSSKTANSSLNESGASSKPRTPKKSRWDAVMSRIAAGQAEEKAKAKTGSRKEIKSRINTNLATTAATVTSTDKENREPSRSLSGSSGRGDSFRKPAERKQGTPAHKSSDTNANEVSDRSASSKLPRASTASSGSRAHRPSALPRASSQLSIASGHSQASTLSQMTLASHLSNGKPGCDISTGSTRVTASRVPQVSKKPVAANRIAVHRTRAPPPPTAALSARPRPLPPTRSSCSAVAAKVSVAASNQSSVTGVATGARPKTKAPARKTPTRPVAAEGASSRRTQAKDTIRLKQVMPPTVAQVSASSVKQKEVSRLEELCEVRTKEVSQCRMQMRHNALAAQAFSTIISYLAHQLDAFSVPRLQHELRIAQEVTRTIQTDLEHVRSVLENSEKESVAAIDIAKEEHRREMESLIDGHERLLLQKEVLFKNEMEKAVGSLQQQYDAAKGQLKELESLGKDKCVSCVQNSQDAESLRTVLVMKNQEIKDLQRDTFDLKAKEDELDYARERVKALENKVEDLTAQLKASIEKERKLTWDIVNVKETCEKDNKLMKRLSMENETLQYKLHQYKDISPYMGAIDGSDSSGGSHPNNMPVYFIEDGSVDGYGSPIENSPSPQRTPNCRPSSGVCLRNNHGYYSNNTPHRPRPTSSPSQRLSPKDSSASTPPLRRPRSSKSVSDGDDAVKTPTHSYTVAGKLRNKRPNGQQQKPRQQQKEEGDVAVSESPISSVDPGSGAREQLEVSSMPEGETRYFSFSSYEVSNRKVGNKKVTDEDEEDVDLESCPEKVYESGRSSGSGSGMEDSGHSGADSILGIDLGSLDADAARLDLDMADNDEEEEEEDFESFGGRRAPVPLSVTPPPISPPATSGRTVIIRYRPNREMSSRELSNGWRDGAASESGDSRSGESSTRSSPRPSGDTDASDELPRSRVAGDHLQDLVGGCSSPRTSAGEAMMVAEELLPAKVLDNLGVVEGGFRREDTPEESSQAVAPTDSTNNDYSWSDDELPSETEV